MAATDAQDDRLLIQYLLGALPDEETERLDELSIVDDQVAADLRVAEHDLVDAYARGALSGETLRRFETHYLARPKACARVAFAQALYRYERAGRMVPRAAAGAWRGRTLLPWGLAAAAAVLLAAGSYLLSQNVRLKHEVVDVRAGLEARQQQLERQLQQAQSTNVDTARELEQVRQSLAQRKESAPTVAPRPVIASLVLLPPTRGLGELPRLSLPQGAGTVAVRLNLEANDFPTYRVALRDSGTGHVVWRSGNENADRRAGGATLSISIGAEQFGARRYTFDVSGTPGGASAPVLVASYPFEVVLK